MHSITLNVVPYAEATGKLLNGGQLHSHVLPLGAPVPSVGDTYVHQYWALQVFDVRYSYFNDTARVDLLVYVNNKQEQEMELR